MGAESITLELLKHSEIDFDYRGVENTTTIELAVEMELPNILTWIIHLGGESSLLFAKYEIVF